MHQPFVSFPFGSSNIANGVNNQFWNGGRAIKCVRGSLNANTRKLNPEKTVIVEDGYMTAVAKAASSKKKNTAS